MTTKALSRRDFLRVGMLSLGAAGALAFRSRLPIEDQAPIHGYGRITWDWLPVRDEPAFNANQVGRRERDQVIPLLERFKSPNGPAYNPHWYRLVGGGYLFSGYVQPVRIRFNPAAASVPETGRIGEISLPFTDSLRYNKSEGWTRLYRLYYSSTHWITDVTPGPDGRPWYEITDDLHRQKYYARGSHIRLVEPQELEPLSPNIAPEDKRVEVNIETQLFRAFERDEVVYQAKVATGVPETGEPVNGITTDTPFGAFRISRKMPVRHMGNGDLVADLSAYELPGVPWVSYFVSTGVAFHGAYWHDNYGRRMSHGCVNMKPEDAKWLFRWAQPTSGPTDWYVDEAGTRVTVI